MSPPRSRTPLRVFVVEPPGMVRDGLVLMLGDRPDVVVCGVADSLLALLHDRRLVRADVMLVDLDHATTGPAAAESLLAWRATHRADRVVGLSRGLDTAEVRRLRSLGIDVLVERGEPLERLVAALHEAHDGPGAVRPSAPAPSGSLLTPRERSVLELIARGHTSREVASHLNVSPRTVENHKQRIFSRLGVQNQAQAVAVATRLGLIHGGEAAR